MIELAVVTVTHNSSHILGGFFASLGPTPSNVELVVVDSGSADIAATRAIAARYEAQFHDAAANVGYGTASNLGASLSGAEWLAFLNPDVEMTIDALLKLVQSARRYSIDCVGPQLVDTEGVERRSWNHLMAPPWVSRGVPFRVDGTLVRTLSISGCAMVIRHRIFERLGGFDESFFMFAEELDLHRRLHSIGGSVAIVSTVRARTAGGGSSAGVSRRWGHAERSVGHIRYMKKHFGAAVGSIDLIYQCVRAAFLPEFRPAARSIQQIFEGRPLDSHRQGRGVGVRQSLWSSWRPE